MNCKKLIPLLLLAAMTSACGPKPTPVPPTPTPAPTGPCRLAYVESTGADTADIFVQDCDGANWRRVTEGRISSGHEPAWSPDGQRLVFDVDGANEQMSQGLYIVNADGSDLTQIVAPDGPVQGAFPVWSPDGERIAWNSGCDVMASRPDGSDQVTVLEHRDLSGAGDPELCVHRPMWSPDSQRLAFATFLLGAADSGSYEYRIYLVNADRTGLVELETFTLDVSPTGPAGGMPVEAWWSPDGAQVAAEMRVDDQYTMRYYLMNADGSGEPVEVESIPDSWRPWRWPQWDTR